VNIQGTFKEHSENMARMPVGRSGDRRSYPIAEPVKEHSVNIQGTCKEHSVNITGTFKEHSVNITEYSVNDRMLVSDRSTCQNEIEYQSICRPTVGKQHCIGT